jgi:transcriptional regulator with XRE-family HTH domain
MGTRQRNRPRELPGKLREIRARLKIGQAEMASRLQKVENGVYPGMVSRYEHGKLEPSLIVLLEYARLGGVSTDTLIDDKLKLPKA